MDETNRSSSLLELYEDLVLNNLCDNNYPKISQLFFNICDNKFDLSNFYDDFLILNIKYNKFIRNKFFNEFCIIFNLKRM